MTNPTQKMLPLKAPLTIDERSITELSLREPTAGELDDAEANAKTNNGTTILLLARVTGENPNVIKQLGARDYKAASDYLKSFLQGSPEENGEAE
jgi:hypothetical protein